MRNEYEDQCSRLRASEKRFRKVGRKQIEERAIRRKEQGGGSETLDEAVRRGIKSLRMTHDLCGLLRKINNTRRMLYMPEVDGCKLLR